TVSVHELHPSHARLSERLFGKAGEQVRASATELGEAYTAYAGAAEHAGGAAVNVGFAAGHTVAAVGDATMAVVDAQSAEALELAEQDARAAAAALRAADG